MIQQSVLAGRIDLVSPEHHFTKLQKKFTFHPYEIEKKHEMKEKDFANRLEFTR